MIFLQHDLMSLLQDLLLAPCCLQDKGRATHPRGFPGPFTCNARRLSGAPQPLPHAHFQFHEHLLLSPNAEVASPRKRHPFLSPHHPHLCLITSSHLLDDHLQGAFPLPTRAGSLTCSPVAPRASQVTVFSLHVTGLLRHLAPRKVCTREDRGSA